MSLQSLLALGFILRADVLFIGYQRDLGVDNNILFIRQMNNDIGLQTAAILLGKAGLGFVFVTFAQAGFFQHPLQYHFTPVASGFAVPFQSSGKVHRLGTHSLIDLLKLGNLFFQRAAVAGFLVINMIHPRPEFLELVTKRRQQRFQCLAAGFVKSLLFLLKDRVGELLKLSRQLVSGLLQQSHFFIVRLGLFFQSRCQAGVFVGLFKILLTQLGQFPVHSLALGRCRLQFDCVSPGVHFDRTNGHIGCATTPKITQQ